MKMYHERKILTLAVRASLVVAAATLLVTWSWNGSVASIWDLRPIGSGEALGFVVLAITANVLVRGGGRRGGHKRGTRS